VKDYWPRRPVHSPTVSLDPASRSRFKQRFLPEALCGMRSEFIGFPSLLAYVRVSVVPPLRTRSRLKITVPSLSSMFLLVRAEYELVEVTYLHEIGKSPGACWRSWPSNVWLANGGRNENRVHHNSKLATRRRQHRADAIGDLGPRACRSPHLLMGAVIVVNNSLPLRCRNCCPSG
jgi:hypothetical protein